MSTCMYIYICSRYQLDMLEIILARHAERHRATSHVGFFRSVVLVFFGEMRMERKNGESLKEGNGLVISNDVVPSGKLT
jgi:hypothetical protein